MVAGWCFFLRLRCLIKDLSLILEWEILRWARVTIVFNFYLDWISLIFFGFVSLISRAVFLYRDRYISGIKRLRLFMVLVLLFVARMFFLVFRLNLISVILGWDGLGVVSYILVVFYKNEKSSRAGMITALSNRVGDAALLLRIACFLEIGSWNYMCLRWKGDRFIWFIVCLAAITKRAQIPFSAWLPAAMAAPTPVRALVHSSTLVTAGVYLLVRFRGLLLGSKALGLLVYIGVLTTIIARLRAVFEVDFKKVVALSTLRQLGIMVITLSIGFVELAFIHLLIHAVFKALLFICRGKVIHRVGDNQDIRKIGGLIYNLPVTSIIINLSRLALCGVPFISGFYSKDLIIERMEITDNFFASYIIYILVVGLSSRYSLRLVYMRLIHQINQNFISVREDKDCLILGSKVILLLFSVVSGSILIWLVLPVPIVIRLRFNLKWLAFISISAGGFIGLVISLVDLSGFFLIKKLVKIETIIIIWNLPSLRGITWAGLFIEVRIRFKKLDLGWLEKVGGQGGGLVLTRIGSKLSNRLRRVVKNYLVVFLVLVLIFLSF